MDNERIMTKIDNNVGGQIIIYKIYYYIKQSERNQRLFDRICIQTRI